MGARSEDAHHRHLSRARLAAVSAGVLWQLWSLLLSPLSAGAGPANDNSTGLPAGTELDEDADVNPSEVFYSEVLVQPARCLFADARQSSVLTRLFVPADSEAPCTYWQAAAVIAGAARAGEPWRCEKLDGETGTDSLDALLPGLVGYRVLAPGLSPSERWIDRLLRITLRVRTAVGGTLTLEQSRLEPQAASLFNIPAGFTRLDPQALFERLRHSDVWVDRPQ